MKEHFILIGLLFLANGLNAQSYDCRIHGTIQKSRGEAVENHLVVIFKNTDTLCKMYTDKMGSFDFSVPFTSGNDYSLLYETLANAEKILLFRKTDSVPVLEYTLNLTLRNVKWDKFDNSAYYELNEIKAYQNFDLAFLKYTLAENPEVCVKFIQTWNPQEKKTVARKRMKLFRKQLFESGINPKQVSFSKQILNLSQEKTPDMRSRIQGVVASLEGVCK